MKNPRAGTGGASKGAKGLIAFSVLTALALGCHNRKPDPRIRMEINPKILKAGTVVQGKVWVEGPVSSVWGKAEVWGSPSYKLKKDDACACWTLRGQVPRGQRLKTGRYRVRVEARFEDGSRARAWEMVELK